MAWWVALGGAALSADTSARAAQQSAAGQRRATAYGREQFDITQEQLEPYREIGLSGLESYEEMLGEYEDREGGIRSDVLGAYQSGVDIPEFQGREVGDYEDRIQKGVPEDFAYDDFMNDPGRLAAIEGGQEAVRSRMGDAPLEGMDELSSNLASRQYAPAYGRAREDYGIGAEQAQTSYLRGVDEYGRLSSRDTELYGRERQDYADAISREQELESRAYRDYGTRTAQQEEQYQSDLEGYGRDYIDVMNQYANLSGIGQTTTTGLGQLRQSYADRASQNISAAGRAQAAGMLGAGQAVGSAVGSLGSYYRDARRV